MWRSYLHLLQMGFTKPRRCRRAGALLPHRFSFSPARGGGVFFSVALSVGSPRPAVSWHLAPGSPDFPHTFVRGCPAHSRCYSTRSLRAACFVEVRPDYGGLRGAS